MEFPRNVYRSATQVMSVATDAERQTALKTGWFDSVPEAIAGKHNVAPVVAPVTVFKKTGAQVEKAQVKNQAEADALITGDGWHPTEAAAIKAAWPAPDAVPGIIEDLSKKTADEIAQYAAGLGMKPQRNEKPAAMLARIETTLLTPPAA